MAGDAGGVRPAPARPRRAGRFRALIAAAAAALAAAVLVPTAAGALFFLFRPTAANPGDRVTVRLPGTPATFTDTQRAKPLLRPIRVYLVRNDLAASVRGRFDRRLTFVAEIRPDRHLHGLATFSVPPLDTGAYAAAVWCPGCGPTSFGHTFFTLPLNDQVVARYRPLMLLHVTMADAKTTCPLTRPNARSGMFTMYGNGFLSTHVATDGGLLTRRETDGTFFTKLGWLPRRGFTGTLTVRGERLDAPAPRMRVLGVHWGHNTRTGRGSWASAVEFPSEGCWRLTGRVGDITLSYVVRVIGV